MVLAVRTYEPAFEGPLISLSGELASRRRSQSAAQRAAKQRLQNVVHEMPFIRTPARCAIEQITFTFEALFRRESASFDKS